MSFVQAEEGGVDDFVFMDQSGAGQGFAFETVIVAVANGGELALFGRRDFVQEFPGVVGNGVESRRLLFGFKQAVQGVTANQFRVDFGVGARARDHFKPDRGVADEREEANLARAEFEYFIAFAQFFLAGCVNVVHGGGGRTDTGFGLEFGDAMPDFGLVGGVGAGRLQG